jgi:uncharacterized protein YlxW (UPF0749 family)
MIAATIVLAVVFIVIGIAIGGATTGGARPRPATSHVQVLQAQELRSDSAKLGRLQAELKAQSAQLAAARAAAGSAQAELQCWKKNPLLTFPWVVSPR